MNDMDFSDWINKKFYEWRGETRKTIEEFADYIGVSQPLMSQWMKKNGKVPKSKKHVDALINKYGIEEVYKILPELGDYNPPPSLRRMDLARDKINRIMRERNLTGENPEAEEISIRIMGEYGFKYKTTTESENES